MLKRSRISDISSDNSELTSSKESSSQISPPKKKRKLNTDINDHIEKVWYKRFIYLYLIIIKKKNEISNFFVKIQMVLIYCIHLSYQN